MKGNEMNGSTRDMVGFRAFLSCNGLWRIGGFSRLVRLDGQPASIRNGAGGRTGKYGVGLASGVMGGLWSSALWCLHFDIPLNSIRSNDARLKFPRTTYIRKSLCGDWKHRRSTGAQSLDAETHNNETCILPYCSGLSKRTPWSSLPGRC